MKDRIVLWGKNETSEKFLLTFELQAIENKVNCNIYPENLINEELNAAFLDKWRAGSDELELPQPSFSTNTDLKVSESFVPEGYTVEKEDLIKRAQTEWNFVVLSAKLTRSFKDELEDLKDKVEGLTNFDLEIWNNLKSFWTKVQSQVRERNLFREHADDLRNTTNDLFSVLKEKRSAMDQEFKSRSQENLASFMEKISEIEEKLVDGGRLQALFDQLKAIQRKFKDTDLTRGHRSQVWKKLDATFKAVKEKKFGPESNQNNSAHERITRRHSGLVKAIEKMESSIARDKRDFDFQGKRIESSEGQLESQIRQAKIKMIEERIHSKEEKLKDMLKTRDELEQKIKNIKDKEERKKAIDDAKMKAKAEIAEEIKKAEEERQATLGDKISEAASQILNSKEVTQTKEVGATILTSVADSLEDVIDTAKAVVSVVADKIEHKTEQVESIVESVGKGIKAGLKDEEEE